MLAGGTGSLLNPFMRVANKRTSPWLLIFVKLSNREPWPIHTLVNAGIENILVPTGPICVILGDNTIE